MVKKYFENAVLNNKEDVLPPFDDLMDIVGFEGIYLLSQEMGGSNLYIPSIHRIFRECLCKQIPKEFDGSNYRELCKRYGLSERTIRTIIEEHNRSKGKSKVY